MDRPKPPKPEKIRQMTAGHSFGWVDHRIKWFWEDMSREEILLYFFLITVSNEQGCSWWSSRKITKILKIGPAYLQRAREMLEKRNLIAVRKDEMSQRTIYQLLPLPIEENVRIEIPMKLNNRDEPLPEKHLVSKEQQKINLENIQKLRNILEKQ